MAVYTSHLDYLDKLGKKEVAEKYTQKAKEMAAEWVKMARQSLRQPFANGRKVR